MIGYRISLKALEKLIDDEAPGWLAKAKARTTGFATAGKYVEASSIWTDVKVVYMRLQGDSKCIYCERKLESEELGKIEQDVEHFRPKGSVRAWGVPAHFSAEGIKVTAPGASAPGYHLLPYHLFNYSAACKPCNSTLKSDCFPIAGSYKFTASNPKLMKGERALLIYPVGDFDADPEALIQFRGVSPQPVAASGHDRHRALTTIAFFALDDPQERKNLFRERANIIIGLWPYLEAARLDPTDTDATELVAAFLSPKAPHTNCARSFARLHQQDRAEAKALFAAARALVKASS